MIYIIRHGQTELNRRHALQGRSDHPLNDLGLAQARQAARRLGAVSFDLVLSSPLRRAIRTAEIVAPGKPIVVDERLTEMDYGPYEGSDLSHPAPEIVTFFSDFVNNPAPAGMEPLAHVVARVGEVLDQRCRTTKNVLISTHAIAMKGILEYLSPGGRYWSMYIGNCDVYTTSCVEDRFTPPVAYRHQGIESEGRV